jgi:SH3 domain-containing YSC84-like protein 1
MAKWELTLQTGLRDINSERIEVTAMKQIGMLMTGGLLVVLSGSLAWSSRSDRRQDVARIQRANEVFQSIMATPDHAIPRKLLHSAKCLAIIPGEKQAAFLIGGKYGKGLVTCRTANGWSAPAFLSLGGGSYGFQIGGSSTDIVMVFENRSGLRNLLSDKFRLGAGATAAAGPVGRDVSASTDIKLHSEILTYARSRGAFAGVSLNGAVVQPDDSGNAALYGEDVSTRQILAGEAKIPSAADPLIHTLARYSRTETASGG